MRSDTPADKFTLSFRPVPFYCEENVWTYLRGLGDAEDRRPVPAIDRECGGAPAAYALFVSNGDRSVAFRSQMDASGAPVVLWDYHVVALICGDSSAPGPAWSVVDFNCSAGLRLPLRAWLEASFGGLDAPSDYQPLFRAVPRDLFLDKFRSDRSHMRRGDGSWLAPPPPWPPIAGGSTPTAADTELCGTNLELFVDMEDGSFEAAMTIRELERSFPSA